MTEQHYIVPPTDLMKQWQHEADFQFQPTYKYVATEAAQWGANRQLEKDAEWLDANALFTNHLIITPSGDALRQVMRPKPPSLKEQALALLDKAEDPSWDINDFSIVRKALEQLPE